MMNEPVDPDAVEQKMMAEDACPICNDTGLHYFETDCKGCSGILSPAHESACGVEPCECQIPKHLRTPNTWTPTDIRAWFDAVCAHNKVTWGITGSFGSDLPTPAILALVINTLLDMADEHEALFELQHRREQEAIERWRADDPKGRHLTMPDYGRLLDWLHEQLKEVKATLARAENAWRRKIEKVRHEYSCPILADELAEARADLARAWEQGYSAGEERTKTWTPLGTNPHSTGSPAWIARRERRRANRFEQDNPTL